MTPDPLFPPRSPAYVPLSNKTRTALWLVSNCRTHSERERYVGELVRSGLDVDVLGACGAERCDSHCEGSIAESYR